MTARRRRRDTSDRKHSMSSEYRAARAVLPEYADCSAAQERVRFRAFRSWGPVQLEGTSLDSRHVALLARAVMAERVGRLLGETPKLSATQVQTIWWYFDLRFAWRWLPDLFAALENASGKYTYAQTKNAIEHLANEHWSKLPRRSRVGRPRIPPPPVEAFDGIEDLADRLARIKDAVVGPYKRKSVCGPKAWKTGAAVRRLLDEERFNEVVDDLARRSLAYYGFPIEMLRDKGTRAFLVRCLTGKPTEMAVRVAWRIAQEEHRYRGEYRAFYDAWREFKRAQPG